MPEPTAIPPFVLYRNIHKLPLSVFVDCAVDGDLSLLCAEGEAPQEALEAKWIEIVEAYAAAIGQNIEGAMRNNLTVEVLRLTHKVSNGHRMVDVLKEYYIAEFAAIVNNIISADLSFDVKDTEAYDKDIESARTQLKGLELRLQIKTEALQVIIDKEAAEGVAPTREYFSKILANISDQKGREISDDITLGKFCVYIAQYTAWVERQNKKE